ncbi:MAG: M20/M25/M40 family metallo-hydrolase [Clostridia bacterium]|nr:M20/M25/M40 family metallo-hydrolase [Clostridia bacterium]
MNDKQLVEKLSNAYGVSGFEDDVIAIAREYLKDIADFEEDSMRNLYIRPKYNKGIRPQVLLDAHSDEVGFMVQAIKPDGTLRFIPVGGWNEKSLPSSKVAVYTKKGYITGVIAAQPPHLMTAEQRNAPVTISSLFIDIGATSAEEAAAFGVEVGAPVAPATKFEYDEKHGLYHGKAFDDRLGVAALLIAVKELAKASLNVDILGVISSQEEVGERGITAAMHRIKPDAAICIEGCPADDTSAPSYMIQDAIRSGVMLRHMDATVICTPRFNSFAQEVAKESGVKIQMAVRSGGGNNGAYIVSSNGGTPVIVAGIPVRYIHTFNCIAAEEDLYSTVNLCVELCKKLDGKVIKGF